MIDYTTPYIMGNVNITGVTINITDISSILSPNPVKDKLNFTAKDRNYTWEICNTNGSQLLCGQSDIKSINLNVAGLKPGLYLFVTHNSKTNRNTSTKFIKE
jgi:hypothetical protein